MKVSYCDQTPMQEASAVLRHHVYLSLHSQGRAIHSFCCILFSLPTQTLRKESGRDAIGIVRIVVVAVTVVIDVAEIVRVIRGA